MSDWRSHCQPIRDQGTCGSCTGMGTCSIMELRFKIRTGEDKVLSVHDLLMCSGGSCNRGNTMPPTFARAMRGVPLEVCCPYKGRDSRCGEDRCDEWWLGALKISSWVKLNSRKEIDEAIDEGGVVGTMAVPQSFLNYLEGDYHPLPIDPIIGYHCIAVVGRDAEREVDLIRNSWSADWGMEGYCWIQQDTCELEYYMILLDGEVSPDNDDDPPECPYSSWFWRRGSWGRTAVRLWRGLKRFFPI